MTHDLTVVMLVGSSHRLSWIDNLHLPDEVMVVIVNLSGSKLIKVKSNWRVLTPSTSDAFFDSTTNQVNDFASVRNWALSQVVTDWVMFLDADERIDPSGWPKILATIKQATAQGYYLTRQEIFAGQPLRYGETGGAKFLRLFRTQNGRWLGKVHEKVVLSGQAGQLDVTIRHHSHPDIAQFIHQVSHFAAIQADAQKIGRTRLLFQLLTYPVAKFWLNLIFKSAWRDGWRGVVYLYLMSLHSLCVRIYQWQKPSKYLPADHRSVIDSVFWLAGFILVAGVALGQLGRLTSYLSFGFYIHDLGVVICLIGLMLEWARHATDWRQRIGRLLPTKVKIVIGWLILSVLMSGLETNSWLPIIYGLRTLAYGLILVRIYRFWTLRSDHATGLIILLSSVFLTFSFYQYLFWPDMRFLATLSFDDHFYRLIGAWFDPAVTGGVLILLALYWLHRFLNQANSWRSNTALVISGLSVLAVGLTFSRASYLALTLGLAVLVFSLGLMKKSWRPMGAGLALVLCLGVAVLIAPKPTGEGVRLDRTASITARVNHDQTLIQNLTVREWLFGQGLFYQTGQSQSTNHARLPNNILVFLITNLGLAGTFILINLIWPRFYPVIKNQPLVASICCSLLVAAFFNNILLHPAIWLTAVLVGRQKITA